MPSRRKSDAESDVLKVRLPKDLRERCDRARRDGAHSAEAESTFLGYLVHIGLTRYEQIILPVELGEEPPGTPMLSYGASTSPGRGQRNEAPAS
jgi:hypothetical protein